MKLPANVPSAPEAPAAARLPTALFNPFLHVLANLRDHIGVDAVFLDKGILCNTRNLVTLYLHDTSFPIDTHVYLAEALAFYCKLG